MEQIRYGKNFDFSRYDPTNEEWASEIRKTREDQKKAEAELGSPLQQVEPGPQPPRSQGNELVQWKERKIIQREQRR